MVTIIRSRVLMFLKFINLSVGIIGIAMILYTVWMVGVWRREMEDDFTFPWFIVGVLGTGVTLCVIACIGHFAAKYGRCLSCYVVIIILVLMVEALVMADIILNDDWEKDFPDDQTGVFDDFKDFVESNSKIFKWIVFLILLAQIISISLAMVLKSHKPEEEHEYVYEDEYAQTPTPPTLPLLSHHSHAPAYADTYAPPVLPPLNHPVRSPPYAIQEPHFNYRFDAWNPNK